MPASITPDIEVIVTIQDADLSHIQAIASELETAGLHLEGVLSGVGVVTGTVQPDLIAKLRRIEGVLEIEQSGLVQI
ncbi:hypothetical protein [Pseudomonas sp. URMO17WK12:I11]|uniref:hypothetical protein n=1 Tax=Pseudomonas sp. URMO17WK12:I11 TaxID=1283291 RepID=UPI00074438C0|nr:hypothetical protein [Pseudomonas sp. URMO17WK12:I11]